MTADVSRRALAALAVLLIAQAASAGHPPAADDAKAVAFFEAKIRPVLAEHCYKCHSAKTGKSEGNLFLDSRTSIRAGGDRGPAIVPGNPDKSVLLTAISHTDPDLQMPPRKPRLPEAVIADFKTWIKAGAADPRGDAAT